MRRGVRGLLTSGLLLAVVAAARPASACSGGGLTPPIAVPRTGATNVPTATSLVIVSSWEPTALALVANGAPVALGSLEVIGQGNGGAKFWRVKASGGTLPANETLVLTAEVGGARQTLTTFMTGASATIGAGTPATLESLSLVRVRYPVAEINAGRCVSKEYEGFVNLVAKAAVIPGVPPDAVISTMTLEASGGGAPPMTFTYTGPEGFPALGTGPDNYPASGSVYLRPVLEPGAEYCATITSFGAGDLAGAPLVSNKLCASVTEAEAGTPSVGGAVDAAPAARPDAASEVLDGGQERAGTVEPRGGCAIAASPERAPGGLALSGLALLVAAMRSRLSGGRSARRR